KELIYNLQSFATTEGSAYTSNDAYRLSAHSSRLSYVVGDMMVPLRALFANDPKYPMKTDKTVLSYLLDNLNSYETSNPELIDSTLQKLVALDFKGYDRSISASSISITALESLIFVLATAELFGYEWNNDSTSPKVTGMSGGAITVGDSLVSLRSRLVASGAGDTQVGMIKFLNDSAAAAKNGDVQMDGVNLPVDANTRALCLLQGESKGDVGSCSDTVYTKTIPWALGLISRVIFEGYGPYYNKNRTDGPLSLSGSNYKSSWTTSDFKIKVKDASFAGLGGTQNPSGNGSHYSITEIVKTDAERAVSSDEEAIFKNFMWLVHEKRMVLVIPVNAIMGTAVKDAAYITVVANGLSGLMDAKPCNSANTSCDKSSDNGKWRKAGTFIKPTTTVGAVTTAAATSGDLQTFSDTPGDSVLLVEAWGKDLTGTDPYGFSDALYPILWDLAFTENASPTTFYGAIPPALAKNFAIFERLGFLTENTVTPANTSTYWDKRNKLFPMVAALAKAFKSNTDNTIGQEKNAYKVLTDLAKVLVRPYIYEGLDWTGDSSGNAALVAGKTITTLRIDTASSSDGLRSPFMLEHNYYPNPKYRSLLSLLAEGHVVKNSTPNGRRYQDGLINLISQTNLASGIANLFNEFNKEARKTGKEKMISGLSKIFLEMKTTSESPQANQFNLQTATEDLEIRLRDYTKEKTAPDYTANKTFDYTWNGVDEGMVMVRDLFTVGSKYSIIRNIDNLLDILIDSQPTQAEAANLVEILSAVFADENGKQSSIVTDLIIVDSPKMLKLMAPAGHDTLGLMNTMTETGGFLAYLQDNLATPYTIADILNDAEQFLNSSIVQSKEKNKSSLIYSTGRLLEDFIPVLQAGKKFSLPGTYFEDSSNSTENADTAFDALNYLFSR
ncbi:MAG: hypothetical protein KDK45_05975, partial [Leptospiraceae bacterium]|nr:hypothetical protein [Leptospiraceae bacterium]